MDLKFSRQVFETHSNIKCNYNHSSGSPVIPGGRAGRRTGMRKDMTQITVVCTEQGGIRNF